jgi:Carboxypeptidase regulatory-like domain
VLYKSVLVFCRDLPRSCGHQRDASTGEHLYLIWTYAFVRLDVASFRTQTSRLGGKLKISRHIPALLSRTQRVALWMGACVIAGAVSGCAGTVKAPGNNAVGLQPAQTFSISGTLGPVTGGGGATMTLSGASSATTTTSSAGTYSFPGLAAGTYAVTPSNPGFTFSPTTQSATITTANITGLNFTATAQSGPTFSISGTITPSSGGSGATVLLSGAAGATTTSNASGSYIFSGLANGNYSVTPNNSGFVFSPATQSVTLSGAAKTGVNFTAAAGTQHSVLLNWRPSTSTVSGYNVYRSTVSGSGYVKLNSSLVASLAYSDATVESGTTYFYVATAVDSGGDESADSNQVSANIP